MASTWTLNNAVEKIADGEKTDTWGQITNRNFDILDRAASGVGSIDLSSSGASHSLTTTDGTVGDALSDGMYKVLILEGATEACTITVGPNDASKIYFVDNNSGYDCTFTQGTGTDVTISSGKTGIIYCDGGGAAANVSTIVDPEVLTDLGLTATAAEINVLDGMTASTAELNVLDGMTATTAELNKLDGVTATTAELNLLDGVTATTAELNILDGVTATRDEINLLDGVTATTAELNLLDGVTATTAEINKLDGVTATTTELNYVDVATLGTSEASKALTADANGDVIISGTTLLNSAQRGNVVAMAGLAMDCSLGNYFTKTISANSTFSFSNVPSSSSYALTLELTHTSGTVTWPSSVKWPRDETPILTTGKTHVFVFFTDDGGTRWRGAALINYTT